jgi:hypothetical protein
VKPRIIIVLLASLFSISVTACSSNKSSSAPVPISTSCAPVSTPPENKSENSISSAMEAYKAVLQNRVEFYNTENKKKVYLNDFLTNENIFVGVTIKINQFTVLDMDGDQIPEVVLKLTVGEENDFNEVLHYLNGEVNGSFFVKNQLCDLKTDGTFRWLSGGLMYNGYGRLKFQNKSYELDELAYLNSKYNDESYTTLTSSYYISNKLVTKDVYQFFVKEQDSKKDAKWYEFSQENISIMTSETAE